MKLATLKNELLFNLRYAVAGVINTLAGLGAIGLWTLLGVTPYLANALGYAVGLVIAYLNSRYLVFRSNRPVRKESIRFVSSFAVCYALNLLVLHLSHAIWKLPEMTAQALAVGSYIVSMYALQRVLVFRKS